MKSRDGSWSRVRPVGPDQPAGRGPSLMKSFAAAVSIILVAVLSYYMFGSALGVYFLGGTTVVVSSVLLTTLSRNRAGPVSTLE